MSDALSRNKIEDIDSIKSVVNKNYNEQQNEEVQPEAINQNYEMQVVTDTPNGDLKPNKKSLIKYTQFASYSDTNASDFQWQTSNQYNDSTEKFTYKVCTKEFTIKSSTYEKYKILVTVMKPFLIIFILIILLIVMFRIDIFLPIGGPQNSGENDPDSEGPTF